MTSGDESGLLDVVARTLREELLRRPAPDSGQGGREATIRALVDRDAAVLGPDQREELVRRMSERSFGLGPLEELLEDPDVDEIMVSGLAPAWVERRGRLEPPPSPSPPRKSSATPSSASSPRSEGASTRLSHSWMRGCPTARGSTS